MLKDIINAVIIKGNRKKNFREVAEEWLIYKKNRVKESTYYNYAYCLEKYIYPKFAKKNIEKIRDYNGYIEELSKELSPKTVRDIVAKLKSIIKYYEDSPYINKAYISDLDASTCVVTLNLESIN